MLLECDPLPALRWCCYCQQPLPATPEFFAAHKFGRHGLATTCRSCANADRTLRRKYERQHPKPVACPRCHGKGQLQVDHEHREYPYAFRSWLCRSCNLRAREPYRAGPRSQVDSDFPNSEESASPK